jgi:hypothetical protein
MTVCASLLLGVSGPRGVNKCETRPLPKLCLQIEVSGFINFFEIYILQLAHLPAEMLIVYLRICIGVNQPYNAITFLLIYRHLILS